MQSQQTASIMKVNEMQCVSKELHSLSLNNSCHIILTVTCTDVYNETDSVKVQYKTLQ